MARDNHDLKIATISSENFSIDPFWSVDLPVFVNGEGGSINLAYGI